jgi:hypothetical protein
VAGDLARETGHEERFVGSDRMGGGTSEESFGEEEDDEDVQNGEVDSRDIETPSPREIFSDVSADDRRKMWSIRQEHLQSDITEKRSTVYIPM